MFQIQEELMQKKEAQKKKASTSAVSVPSVPYLKKRTEIQPFSFDKADQERFSQKERKIQEEIERESKVSLRFFFKSTTLAHLKWHIRILSLQSFQCLNA